MYYNFLVDTFGHPELIGVSYLAEALELYDRWDNNAIMEVYRQVGEQHNTTPSAVERSVRMYIQNVLGSYSKEELGAILHYQFRIDEDLTAKYLIPIIKYCLNNHFNED